MQAHYADAIPLSVLKREQDRIVAELDQVTCRIDAHFGDYADARAHLDDALGLQANCADIYTRCDGTNRRLCNQAFFTKVFIDEENELRVEHNRPFKMLLDPQVNANALTWAAAAHKARTSTNISVGRGSSLVRGVGLFSSHANELRKVHRALRRAVRHDQTPTANDAKRKAQPRISDDHAHRIAEGYWRIAVSRSASPRIG